MTNSLITCGHISLTIYGDKLNFDNITSILELQPTKTIRKGDNIRNNNRFVAEKDLWIYEKKYNDLESLNISLTDFLEEIEKIKNTDNKLEKRVRIYIQSEPAQIFFSLPQVILKKISDLKLDMDISILSWGFAEN
ncbi:MAG: DUF4279 domain-containing protein [Oscillospiraceae bacterium]|nr:DUF4279 domain-containing protein [Oscillospiraceae bacterium]